MNKTFWNIEYVVDIGAGFEPRLKQDLFMTTDQDQREVENRYIRHLALTLPSWQKIISVTATRSN